MDQQRNTKRLKHILSSTYKTRQGLKKSVKRKPSWTQEYLLVVWARWSEQPTQCNRALLTRPSRAMKRHYNQRIIEVEHGSFSPLCLTKWRKWQRSRTISHWTSSSAVLRVRGSRTIKHELNTDISRAEITNEIRKVKYM